MKKQASVHITHSDVENAIKSFKDRGGLIQRLPDQVVLPMAPVASRTQVFLGSIGFGAGPELRFDAAR